MNINYKSRIMYYDYLADLLHKQSISYEGIIISFLFDNGIL